MKTNLWIWLALWFLTLSVIFAVSAEDQMPKNSQQNKAKSERSIMGTINKITNDKITLKTDDGKTRNFSIKQAQRREIKSKDLKKGDRIDLMINQQNLIVGVNKLDELNTGHPLTPAPVPDQ